MPSQTRVFFQGSRISAANRPHGRFLTPRNRISTAVNAAAAGCPACARPFLIGSYQIVENKIDLKNK